MPFTNPDRYLFGVLADPANADPSTNQLAAVQCNGVPFSFSGGFTAGPAWTVQTALLAGSNLAGAFAVVQTVSGDGFIALDLSGVNGLSTFGGLNSARAKFMTALHDGTAIPVVIAVPGSTETDAQRTIQIRLRRVASLQYALDGAGTQATPGVTPNLANTGPDAVADYGYVVPLLGAITPDAQGVLQLSGAPPAASTVPTVQPMPLTIGRVSGSPTFTAVFDGSMVTDGGLSVGTGASAPELTIPADTTRPAITFSLPDDSALPPHVAVTGVGTSVAQPFKVSITDNYGFDKTAVSLEFRWRPRGAVPEPGVPNDPTDPPVDSTHDLVRTLSYAGGWAYAGDPAPGGDPVATGGLASDSGKSFEITGTLHVTGAHDFVEVRVSLVDGAGNALLPTPRSRRLEVAIPTDIAVMLDYSGSMATVQGGLSRWEAARRAVNLFSRLYGTLWPNLTPTGGAAAALNRISIQRFHWAGSAAVIDGSGFVAADTAPQETLGDPPGANLTPITAALVQAKLDLAATNPGEWRNRVCLLMTDGMQNRGTPDLEDYGPTDSGPPTVFAGGVSDPTGQRVHTVSFAPAASTPEGDLADLAQLYGGRYHSTATEPDPNSSDAIRQAFVALLADSLPVELVPAVGDSVTIEDDVDAVAFVTTDGAAGAFSAVLTSTPVPGRATATVAAVTDGTNGFSYAVAADPSPGTWQVSNPGGGAVFALVDLQLRVRWGLIGRGLGEPATLWAEIHHAGQPVSGAHITAVATAPGESVGEVLGQFASSGGMTAVATAVAQPAGAPVATLLAGATAAHGVALGSHVGGVAVGPQKADPQGIRRVLLTAAEAQRGLPLQFVKRPLRLREREPGRYTAAFTATHEDGVYGFSLGARGQTSSGRAFSRAHRLSSTLAPLPDARQTQFTWAAIDKRERGVVWAGTLVPRTATGRLCGPGLAHKLRVSYADPDLAGAGGGAIELRDQLDGSYSVRLTLSPDVKPPTLSLAYHQVALPGTVARSIPLGSSPRAPSLVRVTLVGIEVLDDKDGCLGGKGELSFDAVVAPNDNPARSVRTRIPGRGHLAIGSGERVVLDHAIYEGYLEDGATLDISVGGTEFDWFRMRGHMESLARYRRRFEGAVARWEGSYGPGDEAADPESLRDWRLWYRIDVG